MYRRTNDHLRGDGADFFFHILVGSFFFFCIIGPIFPYTLFGPFFYLARACTVKDDDKNNPCISYINRIDRLLSKSLRDVLRYKGMKTEVMNRVIILSNTCSGVVSTHSKYLSFMLLHSGTHVYHYLFKTSFACALMTSAAYHRV